jgi:hypothetical protein
VKKLAHAWQESKLLLGFAAALRATSTDDLPADVKNELQTMVEWSARHADYVDPLTDLKWTVRQSKNPPWHYEY